MQLKRLDVHGFKTFANATALDFSPGITAIVGPNGSGKSNVSDAVIWGLGESNIRALRGGKLQDVIFAGSTGRRPTGLAEVTLTFDNSTRSLPIDYAEVSVTRRVYRSLESEYFINRTPCRLRDIVDLFLDTGIGRESYFALNQGEIDMVLSANPDERRALFEEAAGIKKYRVRKRESLRKLEATQANLLRIHDLMGEVEARVGPLERQAEGAKRYRELAAKLREAELGAFAASWRGLIARLVTNRNELEAIRTRAAAADAELARLSAEEENTRLLLHKAGEELEEAHRRHEKFNTDRARLEGSIEVLRERIRADTTASERAQSRLAQIMLQKEEIQKSLTTEQDELNGVERTLREVSIQSAALRQRLASAETHLKACVTASERAQAQAVERAGRVAKLEADRDASARRLLSLQVQVTALQDRLRILEERRHVLKAREAEILRAQEDFAGQIEAAVRESNTLEFKLGQLAAQATAQSEDIRARERDIAGQSSRLRLLEEMQDQREGFYKGVKSLLQANKAGQLEGRYHPVADIVTVKREYEAAIEAALGGSVQDIVTETDEEARAGIQFLKRTNAGRATFLSLDLVSRLSRGGQRPSGSGAGVIGTAIDLIDFDALYQPVLEMLLGRVVVCDTLENGNAAAHRLSHWSRMVTLEGELISSQGAMTGGSRQATRASIVGRTGQIQELRTTIAKARGELESLSLHRDDVQAKIQRMRQERAEAEQRSQALRTMQAQNRRDRDHLSTDTSRLNGEEAALRKDLDRMVGQQQAEEKVGERLAVQSLENNCDSSEVIPAENYRQQAVDAALLRDSLREELAQLQAAEAGSRERSRSLRAAVENNGSRLQRLESERRALQTQVESDHSQANSLEFEFAQATHSLQGMQHSLAESEKCVAESRAGRESILTRLESLSEGNRTANRLQQECARAIFSLEAARTAIESEMDRIRLVLAEDYGVPIPAEPKMRVSGVIVAAEDDSADGSSDQTERPPAAEKSGTNDLPASAHMIVDPVAVFLQPITPSLNPERDLQQATRLRRQMRALEPVNLEAIEEAAAVEERLHFLKAQRGDIEAAVHDLEVVIQKIDAEARERFMGTFTEIALHFDDLFRQLFGGGQTRLSLTDAADPTGAGIEISAQPPGKKLQNLQLLSGGERSLTAVALLFAMLRVRPVPFCIMDEVDAALDEGNIARFGELIRSFAQQTQFIIITHNRGTMEVANQLYGVTMTEPGVSRILPLRLEDSARPEDMAGNGHHPVEATTTAR